MSKDIPLAEFEALEGDKFCGIADCHGIESFRSYPEAKKDLGMLDMRAMLNRQRHAVCYLAIVPETIQLQINTAIKAKNFAEALLFLKCCEKTFLMEQYANSWELIPNSKLDPWG